MASFQYPTCLSQKYVYYGKICKKKNHKKIHIVLQVLNLNAFSHSPFFAFRFDASPFEHQSYHVKKIDHWSECKDCHVCVYFLCLRIKTSRHSITQRFQLHLSTDKIFIPHYNEISFYNSNMSLLDEILCVIRGFKRLIISAYIKNSHSNTQYNMLHKYIVYRFLKYTQNRIFLVKIISRNISQAIITHCI